MRTFSMNKIYNCEEQTYNINKTIIMAQLIDLNRMVWIKCKQMQITAVE